MEGCIETITLKLNTKFDFVIIHVPGATFFSSGIIDNFEKEGINGYIRCKEILEN